MEWLKVDVLKCNNGMTNIVDYDSANPWNLWAPIRSIINLSACYYILRRSVYMIHTHDILLLSISIICKWRKQWRDVIGSSLSLLVRPCVCVWTELELWPPVSTGFHAFVVSSAVDRPPSVVHKHDTRHTWWWIMTIEQDCSVKNENETETGK